MSKILILAEQDEQGAIHKSSLELLARAKSAALEPVVVVLNTVTPEARQTLSDHGATRIIGLDEAAAKACERYAVKQQAELLTEILASTKAVSCWFAATMRSKDLCAYTAAMNRGTSLCMISDLAVDGSNWAVTSEIYAGRFIRTDRVDTATLSCLSFAPGFAIQDPATADPCDVETLSLTRETSITFDGDLVRPEKEDGIPLPDAEVVIDIGDGVGTKGAAAARKLNDLLHVIGVKSAVGATRVVTDGGRLPRNAQVGVSGITISPDLIICIGASGSPQHWSGMKTSGQVISVNTDEEAPLQKLADLPILGDGNAFLQSLTDAITDGLTDEQKEKMKTTKPKKPKKERKPVNGDAIVHAPAMEHLPDTPLNIDARGMHFDTFEVYKAHDMFPQWNREKLESLMQKVMKFSENSLNQGKRDAEELHVRFIPGEENEERAVLAPEQCKKGWKDYYKSGFGRLAIPRKFGGLEVPHTFFDMVSEVVNAGSVAMGTAYELTQGASLILQNFGNEWMRQKIIPGLQDGRYQGTMCLTESQAGSDLAAVAATAEQVEGSDEFRINGTKVFITSGDHDMSENIVHIVLAKLKGTTHKGTRAISLFLVPKFWIDEGGESGEFNDVVTQSLEHKHGMTTSPTAVLKFNDSRGYLIGTSLEDELRQPSGMKQMFFMMNFMRHETGTAARGQAMATCLDALVYSMEREQGVSMADRFQGMRSSVIFQHPTQRNALMNMFARTLGGRCMTLKLTETRDRADVDFENAMHAYKEGMAELDVPSQDRKKIEEIEGKLSKIKRQVKKSATAKKMLKDDPAQIREIDKELRILAKQKRQLRKQLQKVSPRYFELKELKDNAVAAKRDADAYAMIFTSLIKAQVTDDNIRTLNEGMNALGGLGFMAEAPVSQRLKDSQVLCIWEGTNDIQALNTVGRQIGPDVQNSRSQSIFDVVMDDIQAFINKHRGHKRMALSLRVLRRYCAELKSFRNTMTLANGNRPMEKFARQRGMDMKAAKLAWMEMVQASARQFTTWFSQAIEAWQLLRSAMVASDYLDELEAAGKDGCSFDAKVFDKEFLEGRIILANHFVSSPDCLDKSLLQWELSFYNSSASILTYGHLADSTDRISMA